MGHRFDETELVRATAVLRIHHSYGSGSGGHARDEGGDGLSLG